MIKEKELNKLNIKTPKEERKYRVGRTFTSRKDGKTYAMMLTYIDARYVMDRFDEAVGVGNWESEFYELKGRLFCRITITFIRDDETIATISKTDCGVESNVEKEKGDVSDAFKRCAVHFGIGRDLYPKRDDEPLYAECGSNGKPPFNWKPKN